MLRQATSTVLGLYYNPVRSVWPGNGTDVSVFGT